MARGMAAWIHELVIRPFEEFASVETSSVLERVNYSDVKSTGELIEGSSDEV